MKKIISSLLILVLLVPMNVVAYEIDVIDDGHESYYSPIQLMAMGDYGGNLTGATWYWPIHGFSSASSAYSKITSSYGFRGGSYNRYHNGVDIGASLGTAVYSIRSGTVSVVDNSTGGSEGRSIIINHNDGYWSVYMHLSSINVTQGQSVTPNTKIGAVGGSGYNSESYYPKHLHMGIHYGSSFSWDCNVNPCPSGYTCVGDSMQSSAGGYPIGSASISYSISGETPAPSVFFDFWDIGDNITISGTYKFWWKQTGYGNCDVNMDINGTPIGTLYQDANGYFSYEFDSTKYANGTYTFGAIIRSTSGAEKYVTRTINIDNTANNPTSAVDICEGVDGGLHIRGWAFDKDNTNETIQVHVYIGGPAGSGEGHVIYANTYRSDVNDVYGVGSNHGFDAIISTSLRGKQNVYIYIINIGAGQNVLHTRENINIPDLHAPTIENITVTNRSSSGYTVTCTFKDDVGLSYATFPTWTLNNGQDDITWDRVELSGKEQTVSYTVKIDKHNNEKAVYYTDIYVYDTSNNSKWGHSSCYVESNPPVISDVKITDISSQGYTITCAVNDAENEISKVLFPTWSDYNGQDDLAYDWPNNPSIVGTIKDGIATFRVNASEHNNETGIYYTHIYAYDSCGNVTSVHTSTQVGEPYTEFFIKKDGQKDIFTINCHCIEKGKTVILALYKENRFVKMYNSIYEGETIPFEVTEDYDSVKVMVWSDFETLSPVCEANSTPTIIE